jgi:vanillate O-demethylase monooxygenase subunit
MFLNNGWYVLGFSNEVGPELLARTVLNQDIVAFRDTNGRARALEDRCCHRAVPLSLGKVRPEGLECGYHGMVFNGDGRCVFILGQSDISSTACVRSYPLVERSEFLWIWMGDPALADEAQIPVVPFDSASWRVGRMKVTVQCDYLLLLENLMDLTHLPYVHSATIGSGQADSHGAAEMTVERTKMGTHLRRVMRNIAPPETFAALYGASGLIDRWQDLQFISPSIVLQCSGFCNAGELDETNAPNSGQIYYIVHGITPETDTSCHYIASMADRMPPSDDQSAALQKVFQEDIQVLEAQQRSIARTGKNRLVSIRSDRARIELNRFVERSLAEEAKASQAGSVLEAIV